MKQVFRRLLRSPMFTGHYPADAGNRYRRQYRHIQCGGGCPAQAVALSQSGPIGCSGSHRSRHQRSTNCRVASCYFIYREEGRAFEDIGTLDREIPYSVTGLAEPEQVPSYQCHGRDSRAFSACSLSLDGVQRKDDSRRERRKRRCSPMDIGSVDSAATPQLSAEPSCRREAPAKSSACCRQSFRFQTGTRHCAAVSVRPRKVQTWEFQLPGQWRG